MNEARADSGGDRSVEEGIADEIRQEARGRSDDYVRENYEDAVILLKSAASRYDELTARDSKSERHGREVAKAEAELREREAAWKAWATLAEERSHAADLAEVRGFEAVAQNGDGPTVRHRSEPLVPTVYAAPYEIRDDEHVAIYGGKDALLIATTGPANEDASHDRALKLVNDPEFRRIVSDAFPEAKDAIGTGTCGGPGDYSFADRMAALARDGAANQPEVVLFGPVAERMKLATALAASQSIQNGLAPLPPERVHQPKDFRELSQTERLQDAQMNAGAKTIAAIDAAIDRTYGAASPEASKMKHAAREAVAQTLEQGTRIAVPRVRGTEWQRGVEAEQARANERGDRERNR